jgi:hypothetical protein
MSDSVDPLRSAGGVTGSESPETLPLALFREFLRQLHNGPPQHAAAVKVALAVWQGAIQRGDVVGAQDAVEMVRQEMNRLVASILELQEEGRRLAASPAGS